MLYREKSGPGGTTGHFPSALSQNPVLADITAPLLKGS